MSPCRRWSRTSRRALGLRKNYSEMSLLFIGPALAQAQKQMHFCEEISGNEFFGVAPRGKPIER